MFTYVCVCFEFVQVVVPLRSQGGEIHTLTQLLVKQFGIDFAHPEVHVCGLHGSPALLEG